MNNGDLQHSLGFIVPNKLETNGKISLCVDKSTSNYSPTMEIIYRWSRDMCM